MTTSESGDGWTPIVPVPEDAPACDAALRQYGKPKLFVYTDADGNRVGVVARYEFERDGVPEKTIRPWTFCESKDGTRVWRQKAIPDPRPLFNLRRLTQKPEARIVVCEGEQKARMVPNIFPDCVGVASAGGAGSAAKTDWSPLKGRDVVIWPDHDKPGLEYAEDVSRLAHAAGAAKVRVVEVPEGFPEAWDFADANPDGVTDDDLRRLLDEAPERQADVGLGEWSAADDKKIPPRAWLVGNVLCRTIVTAFVAQGGTGKTAVALAFALALAAKQRDLVNEHIFQRCRVLYLSLEESEDELRRRVIAAMRLHEIKREEVNGWFYLAAPIDKGWKLARSEFGAHEKGELEERLLHVIEEKRIGAVFIDPFVKSHACEENSNIAIDFVMSILAGIAARCNIAIVVCHHEAKGTAEAGDPNRGRGASAFRDAARMVFTLTRASKEDEDKLGVPPKERGRYIRMDPAKLNLTPPAEQAKWFRLHSVSLRNGNRFYSNGDHVQAAAVFIPTGALERFNNSETERIIDAIDEGPEPGVFYSDHNRAEGREAWRAVLNVHPKLAQPEAERIVKALLRAGRLKSEVYHDKKERRDRKGLRRA